MAAVRAAARLAATRHAAPGSDLGRAREMPASWAADHRAVHGRGDEVVRTAAEAGLIKSEIHRLAGLARRTLDRILGAGGGGQP